MKNTTELGIPKIGILAPLFSLPSKSGIGEFGDSSKNFLRVLSKGGCKLWQMLPISPINTDNSPYSALSSFGIDYIYISLDELTKRDYVLNISYPKNSKSRVQYTSVRKFKRKYLLEAFEQFKNMENQGAYRGFVSKNKWVRGVSVFLALFHYFKGTKWNTWLLPRNEKQIDIINKEIEFQKWLQFIAWSQFKDIKKHAQRLGIELIGDIPFYVGYNSYEVFSYPDFFKLDQKKNPLLVGGVPPDYFSEEGQNWGNPIWNFDRLKDKKYSLFVDRIGHYASNFDYVRLDHFRAFDTYYMISGNETTAINGHWEQLDGYSIINELSLKYPNAKIICEDLGGDLTERIYKMRDHYGFPGMKILEFSFLLDFANEENVVRYSGTHDNQPLLSWFKNETTESKARITKLLNNVSFSNILKNTKKPTINHKLLAYFIKHNTLLGVISIVDLLELSGENNRINLPGTVSKCNWTWRFKSLETLKTKLDLYIL